MNERHEGPRHNPSAAEPPDVPVTWRVPAESQPTSSTGWLAQGVPWVIGMLTVLAFYRGCIYQPPETAAQAAEQRAAAAEAACSSESLAYEYATKFMYGRLKAPATAKFPDYGAAGVRVGYKGHCRHIVKGYVDAENSFSAMIRTHYVAELHFDPNTNKWVLDSIVTP